MGPSVQRAVQGQFWGGHGKPAFRIATGIGHKKCGKLCGRSSRITSRTGEKWSTCSIFFSRLVMQDHIEQPFVNLDVTVCIQ